jgi:flagellar biosynthetic protein FliR
VTIAVPIAPVEVFILVATRVLAVLATSPVLGLRMAPASARLGLGLFTALILVPVLGKDTMPELSWTSIAGEAVVGAVAGFAATLVYAAIQIGTGLLDLQAGFSLASLYDASFGESGALIERVYNMLAALLFLQSDAHHLLIQSLAQLFTVVPLGTFSLSRIHPDVLAQIATGSFIVAIELVFPVMLAMLLADATLGILTRVAPQFGLFSIGLQLKVGLALGCLWITVPLLLPRLHALFGGVAGVSLALLR